MACVALFATQAFGQNLKLGPMFTDGMVLQQGQTVPVWGNAKPKATVKITFGRTKVNVKADANGYWKAMLPRQPASAEGVDGFTITGKGTIDGNGYQYWNEFWIRRQWNRNCANLEALRPQLVYISNSNDVTLQDMRLVNSTYWTNHLYRCNRVKDKQV